MNDERFDLLVARHLDRTLDSSGRAELAAVLRGDATRRREYLRLLEQEELLTTNVREVLTPSARIDAARLPSRTRRVHRRARVRRWTTWAGVAAAASLTVVLGGLMLVRGSAPPFAAHLVGDAHIERGGVRVDGPLRYGDVVIAQGEATLRFPDEGTVRLEPATRVELYADAGAAQGVDLRLARGVLACDLPPQPRGFVVRTAEAAVGVVGTRFQVASTAGVSRVALSDGRVRVRHAGGELDLVPGDQVRIAAGRVQQAVAESPARLDDATRWRVGGALAGDAVAGGATMSPTPADLPGRWTGRGWRWHRSVPADAAIALQARFQCPPASDGIWHGEVLIAPPDATYDDDEAQATPCLRLSIRGGVPSVGRRVIGEREVTTLWTGQPLSPGPHLLRLELRDGAVVALIDGREVWRDHVPYRDVVPGIRWSRRTPGATTTTIDQVALESLLER
jgi:ferric-dicitrate binding protein FerR (iron transport regulator)